LSGAVDLPKRTLMARKRRIVRPDTRRIPTVGDLVRKHIEGLNIDLEWLVKQNAGPFVDCLADLGVLHDLSANEQQRLAQLVIQLTAQGHYVRDEERRRRQRRDWITNGSRYLRKLAKRMGDAHNDIAEIRRHLKTIGVKLGRWDGGVDAALHETSAILNPESTSLREAEALLASLRTTPTTKPSGHAFVALFNFLANECGLRDDEAEVRVGRIANFCWDREVKVIEQSNARSEEWRGCEAVRKAVARHKQARPGHTK
jgi:hypothetical protein